MAQTQGLVGSSEQGPRPQYIKDGLTDLQKEPDVWLYQLMQLHCSPVHTVPFEHINRFLLVPQSLTA